MRGTVRALALALAASAALSGNAWAQTDMGGGSAQPSPSQPALALPSQVLTFKAKPEGHGPNITLGDVIAQHLPLDAASQVVRSSDGPGSPVFVDAGLVALRLRLAPGGPWLLKAGYTGLEVPVPAQKVSGKVLYSFARGYLEQALSGTSGVVIQPQGKVFGLTLYDAPMRLRARPPDDHPLRGYVEMRVDVLQSPGSGSDEDKIVATVPVSFLVQRTEARLFTVQAVNPGDPLGPQNLEAQVVDSTFAPDGFNSLDQVEGRVARAYIPQGRMLDTHMVDLPLAIRRGDEVRLVVRSGAVEVQTTAEAMRDAHLGESLPLRVDSSGQQIQGRCVDNDVAVENAW